MSRIIIPGLVLVACLLLCPGTIDAANIDAPWTALHQLDIPKAKELFTAELKKDPANESLKRGLLLTAYFDMDHTTAAAMVQSLGDNHKTSPYLLPVYELVAAEFDGWADLRALETALSNAMLQSPVPSIRYVGDMAMQNQARSTLDMEKVASYKSQYAPTVYGMGPFENHSMIAAYRTLPFETSAFDLKAETTGTLGVKTAWQEIEPTPFGDFEPDQAFENVDEPAFLLRAYFSLPEDMDINLLLGGPYSGRVYIDRTKVYDDPIMRNAVIREGLRTHLKKGGHELRCIITSNMPAISLRFAIRDTDFKPIPNLSWLTRFPDSPVDTTIKATPVHPIFQPFDSLISANGPSSDTRFWKAILQMFNGYANECITEFEALLDENKLSNLETWALIRACQVNGEDQRANELLGKLKEKISTARTDYVWASLTNTQHPELVNAMAELAATYADRPEIDILAQMKKVLSGDLAGYVTSTQEIMQRHPEASLAHSVLSMFYSSVTGDQDAALRETETFYEQTGEKYRRLGEVYNIYMKMGRYDDAIKIAYQLQELSPGSDAGLQRLLDASQRAMKIPALEPFLRNLSVRYPYDVEVHSNLYAAYRATSQFTRAPDELMEIHKLKPTAITPYLQVDQLHNNVSFDSLFGSVDVLKLWDVTPSDSELSGSGFWYLLDRRQRLLLKGGPVLNDVHWACVLMTDDAVEKDREYNLDVDLSSSFNQLIAARRLRKGQPSLSGDVQGNKVIFKDLRPGDAIEMHYRSWENNSGDLWREYWRSYYVQTDQYQRLWEYTLLTDRDDVKYKSDPPAPAPRTDTYCGYKRIRWSGEKMAGIPTGLQLGPPPGTFTGRISVSTIANWDEVNTWYHSVSEAVLGDNPRTSELARKLTRGLQTDKEKLAALYSYIALQIPYQIIRFDYEGAVPQKPDEVLLRRWGDCKDKAHLLIKMLREVGIQAWPTLVMTRETNVDMPVPTVGFDHLIAACKIGDDTTFIDASGTYYPLSHTISWDDASQPRLLVLPSKSVTLGKLPAIDPKDAIREWHLEIWLDTATPYRFKMTHIFRGISAGNRRSVLNNHSVSGLKQLFESSYSDSWKVTLRLDSLHTDSLLSVDGNYTEQWYGQITLDVQTIDNLSIIKPPTWCLFDDGMIAGLTQDGRRPYPVDTRYRTGIAQHTLTVHIPPYMGGPTLGNPTVSQDSLMQFSYSPEWNDSERTLTLKYDLTIADGTLPLANFQKFARQVMDVYKKPIVVQDGKRP